MLAWHHLVGMEPRLLDVREEGEDSLLSTTLPGLHEENADVLMHLLEGIGDLHDAQRRAVDAVERADDHDVVDVGQHGHDLSL